MVYKKYIKRGKKLYGPYNYHSIKRDGKVISKYLGRAGEDNKKKIDKILVFMIIGLITVFLLFLTLNYKSMTGFAIFGSENENLAFIRFAIELNRAEHLDSDRNFISDIYNEVKTLDDIWSEEIPSEDYIRVTFEQELDNTKDITIYPRIISGTPKIEVYGIDGTEIIAEFTNIISNEYNKVYLTDLEGTQDVFDLRVIDGNLEIEHIVDPPVALQMYRIQTDSSDKKGGDLIIRS